MRKGERKLSLIPYFLELEARENRGLFERLVGRFIGVAPENHSMDEMVKDFSHSHMLREVARIRKLEDLPSVD